MTPSRIHVIARAVVVLDDLLLVVRCKGAANTFLPGGHVEEGERMHDTIAREVREEIGRPCVVGRYLGAIEHAFSEDETTQHEINHLFRVTLPDVSAGQPLPSLESHLDLFWQPVDALAEIDLRPAPVAAVIRSDGPAWASTLPLPATGGPPLPR